MAIPHSASAAGAVAPAPLAGVRRSADLTVFTESLVPTVPTSDVPVVFLHGWGGSGTGTWLSSNLPTRLQARGRSCLIVDLPGHGMRARSAGASHDSEDYDGVVDLVEQALPLDGMIDVVGFSLGAKIALVLASRHPDRVRMLVAAGVGSNIFLPEPNGEHVRTILRSGVTANSPRRARLSAVHALQSGGDPEAMGACLTRTWSPPARQDLLRIATPVLLVVGDEDDVVGSPDDLLDCLPNATLRRLPGIDHLATPYATELHDLTIEFLS